MDEKKSMWAFGTPEVVYSGIGAALYGVLSWATNLLQIPGAANVSVRPAVAIPMFFGVAYGPWVGFITGFLGTVIGDLISGYGFWPWWAIGSGLMGFFTGLVAKQMTDYKSGGDILKAEVMVIVGVVVGMGLASGRYGLGGFVGNVGIRCGPEHRNLIQLCTRNDHQPGLGTDPDTNIDGSLWRG